MIQKGKKIRERVPLFATPVPFLLFDFIACKCMVVISLFFCVQCIIVPTKGIFINVFDVFFQILAVSDDMIVEARLPNAFAVFFVAKAF